MQTYFGFSLLENVEKQCAPLTDEEKRLHLAYMAKAYRVMGLRFSEDRAQLERFARAIEAEQAANTENVAKHSRHIVAVLAGKPDIEEHRIRAVFSRCRHRVRAVVGDAHVVAHGFEQCTERVRKIAIIIDDE